MPTPTRPARLPLPLRTSLPVFFFVSVLVSVSVFAFAQREAVLPQIDLPHPYYYRELYLPQLTTGPSSVAWAPDSRTVIYSMAGSLWRESLESTATEQLTDGPGYHYQPDCSPDGRWVVYASYQKDAVELWALNLETKLTRQLTQGGAVNVEPRFSPDGQRLAFVSTSFQGHFHIFAGQFGNGELKNVQRLTGETTQSGRYYYSQFDHEISPAWSPDGSEILFVSNRGHIYGTGGFWRMRAEPGAEAREIHYEETAWKARPAFSPDGKRIVYASYLGQQWHQLWVIPAQGGDAFPLSYGDFDNVAPRWSPDGKRIAFISNRGGNTSLWIQEVPGGEQRQLLAEVRHYRNPAGHLQITVLDEVGDATPARVFLTAGDDGRAYAPDDAWMHADDNYVRSERPFEAHYFHTTGSAGLTVPAGRVDVEVMKGFEYRFEKKSLTIAAGQNSSLTIQLRPLSLPKDANSRWVSGDVHVHMNYGGTYRDTPQGLVAQAAAENLGIVEDLIVNKEQRIPDIAYFSAALDPASTSTNLLLHGQEFHTSYWGHLGLLNLKRNFLLPGYAGYPNTAAASLAPANATVADLAHEQQGLVGYAHPFETVADPFRNARELPADVALGKVDYIEVVGFADHRLTAEIWYRLLNCGFRLPAAAGTDAMANYSSLRGPVGLNRVYAGLAPGPLKIESWLDTLKHGRTFATNGPILGFSLGGLQPGEELHLPPGENTVKFSAWLRSFVSVDHLQMICNGQVMRDLKLNGGGETADVADTIPVSRSGWCLLRAWGEKPEHPVLDQYPYATTSPIYVSVAGSHPKPVEDATYFIAWIDRLAGEAASNQDWNTAAEKKAVLEMLASARAVYAEMQK
ncbi:MAG TPA: CehA/McbA family metallohydrolase [Terriglobales bacterium]|nr:CehA/McbA family metallohydrolase [Terriglobales bacterium]